MGGASTVDNLVELLDGTQNRHRISLRMEGQMPASRTQMGGSAMAGIDEADDLRADPGLLAQLPCQAAGNSPGADQYDPARGRRLEMRPWSCTRLRWGVFHDSPPICGPAAFCGWDVRTRDPLGSVNFNAGRYHPWQTPSIRFSLKLFNRPNRR
jgi:hypothetical protein